MGFVVSIVTSNAPQASNSSSTGMLSCAHFGAGMPGASSVLRGLSARARRGVAHILAPALAVLCYRTLLGAGLVV